VIYLEQHFDVRPASPSGLDRFIELAERALVPLWTAAGGRLVGAWFGTESWFDRVTQVLAFPDRATFDRARQAVATSPEGAEAEAALDDLAPVRRHRLREPAPTERTVRLFPLPYSPLR
jgi:hypothetical protein